MGLTLAKQWEMRACCGQIFTKTPPHDQAETESFLVSTQRGSNAD